MPKTEVFIKSLRVARKKRVSHDSGTRRKRRHDIILFFLPDRILRYLASRQRALMAYVLVRRGGYGVKEVAEYFGRDPTTISSLLSRYEQKMQGQAELYRETDRLARFV